MHTVLSTIKRSAMSKLISLLLSLLFAAGAAFAQHTETRSLEAFDKVNFDGRVQLFLIKDDSHSIKLDVKKDHYLDDFVTEVRNGTLYLHFERNKDRDRKIKIYLHHTGIVDLDLDGFVVLETDLPLREDKLSINVDGFIRGEVEVDVNYLDINADGFIGLTVSGKAEKADLELDGFGKINAKNLSVDKLWKDADGFARIKVSSR